MKIVIVGIGYVGLSLSVLLSQSNEVIALDILKEKIRMVNSKQSPIRDKEIEEYLLTKKLNLKAKDYNIKEFVNADIVIICTPTNYDEAKNYFETDSVENTVKDIIESNKKCSIIIKSTVPIGFVKKMQEEYKTDRILFSPEFLRESRALYDNLYPSRIIVGGEKTRAAEFADLLKEQALCDVQTLLIDTTEAEAVKLFANTYLAMRISFFNELDTFCEIKNLNSKQIIEGICLDPRIGNYYNNPSFGYGGYCLPKDTKQLLANFIDVPNKIIGAIVDTNMSRIKHIAQMIIEKSPKLIGIYRLTMKADSDNIRQSSIQGVIKILKDMKMNIVIYEPYLKDDYFMGIKIVKDINFLKNNSDLIVANRLTKELQDVKHKVYTRDIFYKD